jgi:hypothetical protein
MAMMMILIIFVRLAELPNHTVILGGVTFQQSSQPQLELLPQDRTKVRLRD